MVTVLSSLSPVHLLLACTIITQPDTMLPNMYYDNRGRHLAHHTLPPIMYHDNRGDTTHRTLQPDMCHDTEIAQHLAT